MINIDLHSTVITPVVDERDNQLNAPRLGRLDNVIQSTQSVGAGVNGRLSVAPALENGNTGVLSGGVVGETPDAEHLHAGLLELVERIVNVDGVLEHGKPVRVGANIVELLAIENKVGAGGLDEAGGGGGGGRGSRGSSGGHGGLGGRRRDRGWVTSGLALVIV